MASILKVDKLDPQSGTALEIGTSGDTVTVPSGVGLTLTDSTLLLPTTITSTTEVKTNKISPATGTAFALGDSGDTFTVPSGATIVNSGTATGFGGDNTPSFRARLATNQSISNETTTKLAYATEDWDTDSAFASNRWTPGVTGKYVINLQLGTSPVGDGNRMQMWFYLNGVSIDYGKDRVVMGGNSMDTWTSTTLVTDLTDTDYIEAYFWANSGGTLTLYATGGYFSGYRIII